MGSLPDFTEISKAIIFKNRIGINIVLKIIIKYKYLIIKIG